MTTRRSKSEKVKRIFQQFDLNRDEGLDRVEMAALVVVVNPRVKFIDGEKGLTFDGLLRTYDEGAGDVDRDFDALGLELKASEEEAALSSSVVMEPHKMQRTAAISP